MVNTARAYTDDQLKRLEKELEKVYAQAQEDTEQAWREYMEKHGKKADALHKKLVKAKQGGNREAIEKAQAAYKKELERITIYDKKYRAKINELAVKLANIDKVAWNMANGYLPDIYVRNYNDIKLPTGYTFHAIDKNVVKNLAFGKFDLLKDCTWTRQRLNAAVLRGILQGESIPQIAKRMPQFVEGNKKAAIRNARTAVTFAENRGRLDSMKDADSQLGLVHNKQWIATHDSRTRDSHREIDREIKPLDEPFSNGLMCPGDPSGRPEEVYNCRCTLNKVLVGIRTKDGRFVPWKGTYGYKG